MGTVRPASHRPAITMLRQLAISVTATVAATLIMAVAQHEIAAFRPAGAVAPEMTSGGKFAARVESFRDAMPEAAMVVAAPNVPVLVADAALHALPLPLMNDDQAAAAPKQPSETARPVRRSAHAEPRHRAVADAGQDVLPPKRSDSITASVATPMPAAADSSILWSTAKALYGHAVGLGGAVLDRISLANLLP